MTDTDAIRTAINDGLTTALATGMSAVDLAGLHRVETENGSHIEPPLDQSWSQLDKLRWNARVVEVDSDLPIGTFDIRQHGDQFAICYPNMGGMHEPYGYAWSRLVALGEGIRLGRRMSTTVATSRRLSHEQGADVDQGAGNGVGRQAAMGESSTEGDE